MRSVGAGSGVASSGSMRACAKACAVLTLVVTICAPALAQSVVPGPFSSWSEEQKAQAAALLKAGSDAACAAYLAAKNNPENAGNRRPVFESAACVDAYTVNHVPPDYPGLAQIKAGVMPNYNNAKALGSEMPLPVFQLTP